MDVNYCVGHLQYFDHHLYVLRGRTTKREVGEKGVGGGRREGKEVGGREREVGEEKFAKWKKTDPAPKKM